jgi:hypothetical protein
LTEQQELIKAASNAHLTSLPKAASSFRCRGCHKTIGVVMKKKIASWLAFLSTFAIVARARRTGYGPQ